MNIDSIPARGRNALPSEKKKDGKHETRMF